MRRSAFKRKVRATGDEIAFFDAGGVVLALWAWEHAGRRCGRTSSEPVPQRFAA